MSNRSGPWVMLSPALILIIVFLVVPFLMAVWLSFTNERLIPRPIPTGFVGFRNYERIFTDPEFWQAAWNTFRFAFIVVPFQTALALCLAMLINLPLKGRNIFRSVYFLPTVITMVVVAVVWKSLLQAPEGILNSFISFITLNGISAIDWLGDKNTALGTIIVLSIWQGVGFQMIIYLAGLQDIPNDLYEAADIDGATGWQKFLYITLPSLRNTHIFVILTTTILSLKLFTQVELLTQGGPASTTNTIVRYMFVSGFREQKVGYAAAVGVLFFIAVVIIALIQRQLMKEDRSV